MVSGMVSSNLVVLTEILDHRNAQRSQKKKQEERTKHKLVEDIIYGFQKCEQTICFIPIISVGSWLISSSLAGFNLLLLVGVSKCSLDSQTKISTKRTLNLIIFLSTSTGTSSQVGVATSLIRELLPNTKSYTTISFDVNNHLSEETSPAAEGICTNATRHQLV